MKWETKDPRTRLCLITAIILLVGLGSATLIYLTAENAADNALVHNFENSKRYIHNLELYGGKMNVLADQFFRWFDGLWHGKSLAFTIACITIFISLALSFVAFNLSDSGSGAGGESNPRN